MQARTEEYARLLRRFSANELDEAYTDVLQTWQFQGWPPPGAFFTVAMQYRKDRRIPEHQRLEHMPKTDLPLPHEHVMAILEEHPSLSETMRRALYKFGTGAADVPWAEAVRRIVP